MRVLLLGSIASIALGIVAVIWVGGKLIAPAQSQVGPPPSELPATSVTIPSRSGTKVAGWYISNPAATATVVLLHPIRSDRRAMLGRAKMLYEAGYASLLVDLQAHGETPGDTITFGHLERFDVTASVAFVRNRNPSHDVAIIGWSLGGAAAVLAAPLDIDALVIESVYPTIEEAAGNRLAARLGWGSRLTAPVLVSQLQPRLGINPEELRPITSVAAVNCPLLVLSGDEDKHTTRAQTERLFAAAGEPKQLVLFPGATHEDLLRYDATMYTDTVTTFLNTAFSSLGKLKTH